MRSSGALLRSVSAILAVVSLHANADEFVPPEMNVPDGFVVEVVAAPPLVRYPMMGCLDDRGRMFIAETHGQNLDKEGLLKAKHRFIRMIEDTDDDGVFDKSTIFADGLVMPEGALWYRGSVYVLSSPYLWRFEDTTGDGVADVRERLVGSMEFNGKANQHGAYLGPCGRLYFSGGTFGYNLLGSDGKPAYPVGNANAAGVFSCRADGTDVEIFATGGINPVEVAFSPEGELFTTCPIIDTIDGRHDALIHWIRGATVGPTDFHPPPLAQTGYRLPPLSRWGQVAPSGLTWYRGEGLGETYENRLFATHFNTRTVVATRLERKGATYRSHDEDFLTSPNPDFHPTDIMQDADGSLLMIDTGGWFRISCPFSKTAKPEIPGAIYRIRREDAPVVADPRGSQLDWSTATSKQLASRLDDHRPAVRDRAIASLHDRGDKAVNALSEIIGHSSSEDARRNAVWAASRIGSPHAVSSIRGAVDDESTSVRHAAVRSLGVLKDGAAVEKLTGVVENVELPLSLRRAAATSLGQIGDATSVESLLKVSGEDADDFFHHAVIYALIEIGDFARTRRGLANENPQVQAASLIALDRINAAGLQQSDVAPLLSSDDERLRRTVLDLVSQRDGWADQIVGFLESVLETAKVDTHSAAIVRGAVVNFAEEASVQRVVAAALSSADLRANVRSVLLESIARLASVPPAWEEPIRGLLAHSDPAVVAESIAAVSASGTRQFDDDLRRLADASDSDQLSASVWVCLSDRDSALPTSAVKLLCRRATNGDLSPLDRLEAAQAIASAQLTTEQRRFVARRLAVAGAIELPVLTKTFLLPDGKPLDPETAHALLDHITKSPAVATLSGGDVQAVLAVLPGEVRARAAAFAKNAEEGNPDRTQRLDAIEAKLVDGDPSRGRQLFFGNRTACGRCHRIGGEGGRIGPDLSRIGTIRRRRDLLESIVYPSATIVNNYESWSAVMTSGRSHTGVIQRATARTVVLRNSQRSEFVLNRADIDELVRQPTSIMPKGLDRILSPQELSDLLAFLESLRQP